MRWSFLALLFFSVGPAHADMIHKLSSSTSLRVDGAGATSIRVPSTYTVSGSNVKVSTANNSVFGGLTAGSVTAAATMKVGTYDINTAGSAFSFSESWLQGDNPLAVNAGVDVSAGVVADLPAFGSTTVSSGGVAGNLAGTVLSSGIVTAVAGGAGTTATGQVFSELTIK